MNTKETTSSGIGFSSLLLVAFIVLKLCKVITWSWVWVLAPFWMPASLAILLFVVAYVIVRMDEKKPHQVKLSAWDQRLKDMKEQQDRIAQKNKTA